MTMVRDGGERELIGSRSLEVSGDELGTIGKVDVERDEEAVPERRKESHCGSGAMLRSDSVTEWAGAGE
jgi:hypothetical protein